MADEPKLPQVGSGRTTAPSPYVAPGVPAPTGARAEEAARRPLRPQLRGPLIIGLAVMILFFGIGGGWAALAPLSGAAIAPGVVSPEGSRQTVQHLEGGIIETIRVRDGDQVQAGDVLMVLQGIGAQAEVGRLTERLRSLAANEARLRAERADADTVEFTHPILADRDDPSVANTISGQLNQFETRRAGDESREAILQQRVLQLERQIIGAERQLDANRRQQELVAEEITDVERLVNRGLERKPRLLALQREQADLVGEEGELESTIARNEEAIGETKLQIVDIKIQKTEDVETELSKVQTERGEVEEEIAASRDRLLRTDILAPVAGTVLNLRFKTPGGVVKAGEEVLDIIPAEDELVVEARLPVHNIDEVGPGQSATVMFPALPQRHMLRLQGEVITVSADAMEDEQTRQHYYLTKVEVLRSDLEAALPGAELTPGMPAEVFIATHERTMLDYLLQPLISTFERTFRET
ncbi:HlyD family type I secretion periplasmic adaptor subunit [Marinivivus vitaminiproducens]|uniref:HlyD family type I secretion periplasmic adaptor subunit n=1 Tax=Marinivivus vitaminiproducens TaxID=3035935 RepID=UPI002798C760|nr:HlyD family type I secretion periplasmic adaptor subunit [Geminicoccaceae bacterium SCSIO 64248]